MPVLNTRAKEKRQSRNHVTPPAVMWRLLRLSAADPRVAKFIINSVESDAQRIADEDHMLAGMVVWQPTWLPKISRQILSALRTK